MQAVSVNRESKTMLAILATVMTASDPKQ